MMNVICLAGMFLLWTAMFGGVLAALLHTFGLPWSLSLTAALPPSVGLSLGLVSLFCRVLRLCRGAERQEPSFREDSY